MNVFDLEARINLQTEDYTKNLESAQTSTESFASKLGTGLANAAKVATAAITAATAAVVAGTVAFAKGIGEVASYADNIDKMSQKMGLSAEAYQEWDFILQHAGSSIEAMKGSMKTLANAVQNGNEAFEKLGMTQEQVASMSQEELFSATIKALQGVEDQTERTYLTSQLLGRGATELGALLNMSAEDVEEMRQQVHDLGGVMSDDAVSAGATYQDSLQNVNTALAGLKNNMMAEFLPSLSTVMDGLAAIFSGDKGGMALVREGILDFAVQMNETLPEFLEIGGEILGVLSEAIVNNLPVLIRTGASVIGTLANGLIKNLPSIIRTGVKIIGEIARGLINAMPELIATAFEIVDILVEAITDPENITMVLEGATMIITKLAEALTERAPDLIPAAIDMIFAIVNGIIENLPAILEAALQLVIALAQGILDAIPTLLEKLPELIDSILNFILGSIPDLIDAGIQLLTALVGALPTIIKSIISVLPKIIDGIITALLENLPLIIDAGISLITALIEDLPTIITTIVEALPEIIFAIIDAIIEHIPDIIDAGVKLLMSLVEALPDIIVGIVTAIGKVLSAVIEAIGRYFTKFKDSGKDLIKKIAEGIENVKQWFSERWQKFIDGAKEKFTNLVDGAKNWGKDMIENFVQGIKDKFNALKEQVLSVANTVKSVLGFSVPEEGPLHDADTYMPDFMNLLAQGIEKRKGVVLNAVQGLADGMEENLMPSVDVAGSSRAGGATTNNSSSVFNVTINVPESIGSDRDRVRYMAQQLYDEMTRENAYAY